MRLSDRKDGPGPARTGGAQSARRNQDGDRAREPPRAGSLDARYGCGGSNPRSCDGNSTRSDGRGLRRYAAHLSDDVRSAENCGAVIHERRVETQLLCGIGKSGQARVIADERVKSAQLVGAVQKAGFEAE